MKRIYKTHFDAAHFIQNHKLCGEKHGHTYHLEITVDMPQDWFDFHLIKENVDKIISQYDHHDLGNMTCEKLVVEIYQKLLQRFQPYSITSLNIKLFETESFGVEYP